MGLFSLKKRSKDKSASPSPSDSPPFSNGPLLGRRAAPPSPAIQDRSSRFASPVVEQKEFVPPVAVPMTTLNVLLDPLPRGPGIPAAAGIMRISVESDAEVDEVAYQVRLALKLPRGVSSGCYKVAIPIDAYESSRAFIAENPLVSVHLVAHFPSYNLEDQDQLEPSLLARRDKPSWEAPRKVEGEKKVRDWWPHAACTKEDEIQVLVRLGEAEAEHSQPLTMLAHFSRPSSSSTSSSPTVRPGPCPKLSRRPNHSRDPSTSSVYSSPPSYEADEVPYPPVAVDLRRDATVEETLDDLMRADGRPGGVQGLSEKVVLWRVDMSWKEMLSCERFGGLRSPEMPWPYPPNAPEPVHISDLSKPISHYFPTTSSNLNLVNLFVYVKPEAEAELARRSTTGGVFVYPPRPPSVAATLAEPGVDAIPTEGRDEERRRAERRRRRGASSRPSTAPDLGVPAAAFGSSSTSGLGLGNPARVIPPSCRPVKMGFDASSRSHRPVSLYAVEANIDVGVETRDADALGLGQSPLELERGVHLLRPDVRIMRDVRGSSFGISTTCMRGFTPTVVTTSTSAVPSSRSSSIATTIDSTHSTVSESDISLPPTPSVESPGMDFARGQSGAVGVSLGLGYGLGMDRGKGESRA